MNYTPLYYMINGVAFNKTTAAALAVPGFSPSGLSARSPETFWCAW